jgi:hypothetical protein
LGTSPDSALAAAGGHVDDGVKMQVAGPGMRVDECSKWTHAGELCNNASNVKCIMGSVCNGTRCVCVSPMKLTASGICEDKERTVASFDSTDGGGFHVNIVRGETTATPNVTDAPDLTQQHSGATRWTPQRGLLLSILYVAIHLSRYIVL